MPETTTYGHVSSLAFKLSVCNLESCKLRIAGGTQKLHPGHQLRAGVFKHTPLCIRGQETQLFALDLHRCVDLFSIPLIFTAVCSGEKALCTLTAHLDIP